MNVQPGTNLTRKSALDEISQLVQEIHQDLTSAEQDQIFRITASGQVDLHRRHLTRRMAQHFVE